MLSLILLSSVFLAFYDICKKASVKDNAVLPVLLCSTLAGFLAFTAVAVLCGRAVSPLTAGGDGVAALPWTLMGLCFVKAAIVASSWVFTFMGLRTLPITIATPIRASAPAAVFVASFFLYGEVPTFVQFVGVIAVLAGYWTFSWAGKAEGIDFFHNRAVWCAIAGACLSAVSSLWDKYLFQVRALPVVPAQFYFQLFLVVIYGVLLISHVEVERWRKSVGVKFTWRWSIPCVGILLAAADYFYFLGIQPEGTPISVCSLLRRFSVVLTFILGAKFFHEQNLVRKGLALSAILIGCVLLCL